MPRANKHNPASRLYDLLSKVALASPDVQTRIVWARALGLPEGEAPAKFHLVTEQLSLMHDELESIRAHLRSAQMLRAEVYDPLFSVIEAVISPTNLSAAWSNYKGQLSPQVLQMLDVAVDLLPNEETSIDVKEFAELLADIETLENQLAQAQIPAGLRRSMLKQCERLRQAIHAYKVIGAKALRDAAQAAVAEIIANQEQLKANNDKPEVSKFAGLVKKMGTLADGAEKADKLVTSGKKLWDYLEPIIPSLPSP